MEESVAAFELPREQQATAALLEQILGKAVSDRYVDFWRLSAGAFDLRVGIPLAAHALRELESTLRTVLAVPMEAVPKADPYAKVKEAAAREPLKALGYDAAAIQRALDGLRPRSNHKNQIEKICERLGFGRMETLLPYGNPSSTMLEELTVGHFIIRSTWTKVFDHGTKYPSIRLCDPSPLRCRADTYHCCGA